MRAATAAGTAPNHIAVVVFGADRKMKEKK
jgi:hypothetical protein